MKKQLTIQEIRKIEINILNELDKVCRKNGFHYYLAYGTLLGAVRHKGFIPWDDDIDVWVPIEEIEDVLNAMEKETKYVVINHLTDDNWNGRFSKIYDSNTIIEDELNIDYLKARTKRGINIDVFPLYNVSDYKKQRKKATYYRKIGQLMFSYENGFVKNKILKIFCFILYKTGLNRKTIREKLALLSIEDNATEYCSNLTDWELHEDKPYKKSDFETIELEFENKKYKAPKGFDSILKIKYGDYMQLPPENKRTPHPVKSFFVE